MTTLKNQIKAKITISVKNKNAIITPRTNMSVKHKNDQNPKFIMQKKLETLKQTHQWKH